MENTLEITFDVKPLGWTRFKSTVVLQETAVIDLEDVVEFLSLEGLDMYAEDIINGCSEYLVDINEALPKNLVADISTEECNRVIHAVYMHMLREPLISLMDEDTLKAYLKG